VHARLEAEQRALEASVLLLARELTNLRPPAHVERAERGYRRVDVAVGETLFVEDPIAAHWHRDGRWGPPLRPDLDRAPVLARPDHGVDALASIVRDGRIAIVTFRGPRIWGGPDPALRLVRAGLARDAALRSLVRWSDVTSVGAVDRWGVRRAAFESGGRLEVLPPRPAISIDDLIALMTQLLKQARP
jgi:hypothetical protein